MPAPRGRTDSGKSEFLSPISPRSSPMFGSANGAGYFDLGRKEKGKEAGVDDERRGSVDSDASAISTNAWRVTVPWQATSFETLTSRTQHL